MAYNFKEMHLTVNVPNRKITKIKALIFHYTANAKKGASAIANRNYFQNHPNVESSANYIIDDTNVVECAPFGMVTWHAGGSKYTSYAKKTFALGGATKPNDFSIGYEICNNSDSDWNTAVSNTIELAASHIVKHKLDGVDLIRHYDVTGKICPKPMVDDEKAWNNFKERLLKRVDELKGGSTSKPTPPVTEKPGLGYNDKLPTVQVVANSGLNVRAGIGTGYSVVATIPNGTMVNYSEESKGWVKVTYKGVTGWCSSDFVKVIKKLDEKIYGKVTATALNVRKGRGTSYPVIGSLKYGETVRLDKKIGDWWSIYFGSNGGFVSADYIKEV